MSAPSSVLMTASPGRGLFASAVDLGRTLARRGVHVVIAVMGGPISPAQRDEAAGVPNLVLHESAFRLEWTDDPWDDVTHAGEWLLGLEERERPAVVHLHGYVHGSLPFRAPKLVVARAAPSPSERHRFEAARGVAAADALVAPTRAVLDAACRDYGAHPRARVIACGRDAGRYHPAPKEDFVLSTAHDPDPGESVAALEAAAPGLPWPVLVAGNDVARTAFTAVEMLGAISPDAAAVALGRASVFALPTRSDPFGLSVLEAALSGCALVLGDVPSLRELWGGAALFVDPADPEDLGRALRCLITHPAVREALAARSRSRALGLSPERTALGYLALYDELFARPTRASDRPRSLAPPRAPRA